MEKRVGGESGGEEWLFVLGGEYGCASKSDGEYAREEGGKEARLLEKGGGCNTGSSSNNELERD